MDWSNPFPGMNPFLEGRGDFHGRLVAYAADALQPQLPGDLAARLEERVFIEGGAEDRDARPDVSIIEERRRAVGGVAADAGVAVAEPLVIRLGPHEVTESFIQILDARSGNRVITMIEFVSPSNKRPGPGRQLYVRKQQEARDAAVNLAEIDLTRGEENVTIADPAHVAAHRRGLYHASVWRAVSWSEVLYFPIPLRARLPVIPIPLRPEDRDVTLDLQALVNQAHERGRYGPSDYRRDPDPPLSPDDADWVDKIVADRGLRSADAR